jgi:hypothetical protein
MRFLHCTINKSYWTHIYGTVQNPGGAVIALTDSVITAQYTTKEQQQRQQTIPIQ